MTKNRIGSTTGKRIIGKRKSLSTNRFLQSVLSWRQPGTDEQPGGLKRADHYLVVFSFVRLFPPAPPRNPQTSCLSMLGGEWGKHPFTLGRKRRWRVCGWRPLNARAVSKALAKLKAEFLSIAWLAMFGVGLVECLVDRWFEWCCSSKTTKTPVILASACAYFPHPPSNNNSMVDHSL